MTAVFKITNGTDTVDFFGGPFYLSNWRPAIAKYKSGGIFLDSPLATGRDLAYRTFDNATERIDLKMRADSADDAAYYTNKLMTLAEEAAEHSLSGGAFDPVWIEVKASKESNTRYALVKKAELTDLENPFSQPFLQANCATVMDNLVLIVERGEWTSSPPGGTNEVLLTEGIPQFNLLRRGAYFDEYSDGAGIPGWNDYNSPSTSEVTSDRAYAGLKSYKIVGTSGLDRGMWYDLDEITAGLDSGTSYTITAKCLVEDGGASLIAYDGGAFTNPVRDDATPRQQELLSNTSFETDLSGWGLGSYRGLGEIMTATRSNTYAYNGTTWSLKLDWTIDVTNRRVSAGAYYCSELIAIPANTTQLISTFAGLRTSASSPDLYYRILCFNADQNTPVFASQRIRVRTANTGQWNAFVSQTRTSPIEGHHIPSNAVYFQVEFFSFGALGTFTFYFDEFSVKATLPYSNESNEWQDLSVTKTATASGIRIGVATISTTGGTAYFDNIELMRDYAPNGSESEEAFVANSCMTYNITHLYYDDGGTGAAFSSNLLDSDPPYNLFPQSPADNDRLYIGSRHGPFANVAFDLGSIIDDSLISATWEYYGSGGWTQLSVRDNTGAFTNSGKQVVSWYVPDDWTTNTVNSVQYTYWVRATLSVTSPLTTAVQANTHVHVVNNAYFEIDSAQVPGHMRSPMKYTITNESGALSPRVVEQISAGANDVYAVGGSLTTGGSTTNLGDGGQIGLRFTSVPIPQGVSITSAKLYATISNGNPPTGQEYLVFNVHGEAADDSAAFSSYSNFIGRTRTLQYAAVAVETYEAANSDGEPHVFVDYLQGVVGEIVQRPGWASGNDMTFFIATDDWPGAGGNYVTFDMYETSTTAWTLEVEYVSTARYTSIMHLGARSVSRGADFLAHLEASRYTVRPPGITISIGNNTSTVWASGYSGSYFPARLAYVSVGLHILKDYADTVVFHISPPLSSQYEGRFRAFVKIALNTTDYEAVNFRLRTQVGSGGSSFTGESAVIQAESGMFYQGTYPRLVDLGPLTIPQVGGADELTFGIQAHTEDAVAIYIMSLILIPTDEWYLEAVQPAASSIALDSTTYAEIDSATSNPEAIKAVIRDRKSTAVKNNMVISGSPASLAPNKTQRVWVATSSILTPTYSISKPLFWGMGTHNDVVHKVRAEGIQKYLGMRGAE